MVLPLLITVVVYGTVADKEVRTTDFDRLLKRAVGTIGLMHDDVLLINFTSTPHSHALFARFFHLPCMLVFFSISILREHICILNARLGGEIDQQNVIMHKAYCPLLKLTERLGLSIQNDPRKQCFNT